MMFKPETARRVRQRIGALMKWAVAMGYRPDNPAADALGQALGRPGPGNIVATLLTRRACPKTRSAIWASSISAARPMSIVSP